ncbi:MAG TPA: PepSY domain-containing protein [Rhizomicrobium sp.]|nr:PepSY domain-containing protein [Rhizomicrobium sp.]
MRNEANDGALYRTLWRWHFYAGLFVLPFVLILSFTGAVYLFKPQIDRWEERAFHNPGSQGLVWADRQRDAALAAYPASRFLSYRLPQSRGDAAMVRLALADGGTREVFVSPQGQVLGALDTRARISSIVSVIHGTLLLGQWGDWLVELAASWTIVLILTGLYLWWPRPFAFAGTFWPRLSLKGRPLLKDIHRVTGFWVAGFVLMMLASGLPWAGAWGGAFKWVRAELGLVQGAQDWKTGARAEHAGHGAVAMPMPANPSAAIKSLPLEAFVFLAREQQMAPPVIVVPPDTQQRSGLRNGVVWTVKSESQNRPLARQVTYDPATGMETGRSGFADKHVIDRIVMTGIAWHEGQLFGVANQVMGLLTAIALIATAVMGVLMWLKRRPEGKLGAPPAVPGVSMRGIVIAIAVMGLLLPLFGASVLLIALLDRIVAAVRRA